jgi:phage shock protein E
MKKHIFLFAALISMGISACAQNSQTNNAIMNLSAERFKVIIANDKTGGVVLDLRTTDEINKGFIKGSVQLDFLAKDAEKQIDKLDKNKTYYLYCASGGRSSDAAQYMADHGFKHIYNLEKGFSDWKAKGYAVEKK